MRVCVAGSFPEALNRNGAVATELAAAFRTLLGEDAVDLLPFGAVETHVARRRPALVALVGSALPAACDYRALARACRQAGSLFAFWTLEDPYEFDVHHRFADVADLVFSNDAYACRFYRRERVHHLPVAASGRNRRSLDGYDTRALDLFFCGVGFTNRQTFVQDAMPVLERRRSLVVGEHWPAHPGGVVVNRRISAEALVDFYATSRCVLNIGRDFSYANARHALRPVTPGPRTFEAGIVGTLQIYVQPSAALGDYLEPGREILTCDTVEEFGHLLDRMLAAPDEARAIAEAAQARILRDHLYENRARTILAEAGLA